MWDLPYSVVLGGEKYEITNECDYRVILDCFQVMGDEELDGAEKARCLLEIFYKNTSGISNFDEAYAEMFKVIHNGEPKRIEAQDGEQQSQSPIYDWAYDWKLIAPAVSRVLGYEIRKPNIYTHWYTFFGAFNELPPDCLFRRVVDIRLKMRSGGLTDKNDLAFFESNRDLIILPDTLTSEEQEYLDSAW